MDLGRDRSPGPGALVDRSDDHPQLSGADVPRARTLVEAIHWTVVYGGIFDYPLTRDEVHQFLVAPGGTRSEIDRAIDAVIAGNDGLETDGRFLFPRGRRDMVDTRLRRARLAARAWKRARLYARLVWSIPYVRMVAVTGALAMDNVEDGDDIDLMIVTAAGRVWLTRGMTMLLVRLARLYGDTLCPNFIISERALRLEQRDPYTAHELAQMVPLHGSQLADRLWRENAWCRDFMPNARPRGNGHVDNSLPWLLSVLKETGQALLNLPPGSAIERWEQRRKITRLTREASAPASETHYTADVCKGHADGHGRRVMDQWLARAATEAQAYDRTR